MMNSVEGLGTLIYAISFRYVTKNWIWLQILGHVQFFLSFVAFLYFIPESPKWLYSNERLIDAKRVLDKMAYYNDTYITWVPLPSFNTKPTEN